MFKKYFEKLLFWGSWWFTVIIATVGTTVIFMPMLIYGLINEVGFKDTIKAFWLDGFYGELKSQYERYKGMGL